jgi:hypothetical protein
VRPRRGSLAELERLYRERYPVFLRVARVTGLVVGGVHVVIHASNRELILSAARGLKQMP